jgi:hypothetical protein
MDALNEIRRLRDNLIGATAEIQRLNDEADSLQGFINVERGVDF